MRMSPKNPPFLGLTASLGLVLGCFGHADDDQTVTTGRSLAPLSVAELALLPRALLDRPAALPAGDATPDRTLRGTEPWLQRGRSYSLGTAARGYLVGGVEMPTSHPFLRARPSAVRKKALWGTGEMVGAVVRAARKIADAWPGSQLWAGDFSAQGGGDLANHASHNSGRDVDLAFFMRDPAGLMADSHRMLPIGESGKARWTHDRFDATRNWALVEAFLRDPEIRVQYIFVARHLERLMLEEARRRGADATVIERAAAVMREPHRGANHEDHFHIRLYCSTHERLEGCVDYGVNHPWAPDHKAAVARRLSEVVPFLSSQGDAELRYAITRIVRLRASAAIVHLRRLSEHRDDGIRRLASDAIAFLEGRRTPPGWSYMSGGDAGE